MTYAGPESADGDDRPHPATHQCPRCGMTDYRVGTIMILQGPHQGHYCLLCYAALIARVVPRMSPIVRRE